MILSNTVENRSVQMRILSDDQIFEIIQSAKAILEDTGCRVLHKGAQDMLKQAGAMVDGERIRVPRYLVEESINKAPKGILIYDREGRPAMELWGPKAYYGTSTASPNTKDALTGEVHPTRVADIAMGAKVADALKNMDYVMPFGSSQDVPPTVADLHEMEAVVTNTTKPIVFCGYSPKGVEFVFEMAAEVAGGREKITQKPFIIAYPEPISPLLFPEDVVERMFVAADWRMPQIPAGASQMGATSPVTLAGSLAQMVAESMMSLVLVQTRNPGAPTFFSGNFDMFDMRTGLNSMASPEGNLLVCAMAEVARFFDLPSWGYAGTADSKILDAQAGIEAAFSILAQGLSGVSLIHDVGYLDRGMICSADMLVMGDEIVAMAKRFIEGIQITRETLALDVIRKVGPGGNFLQEPHTLDHFKECWYPEMFTRESYDTWESRGAKDLGTKCSEKVRKILETHQPDPLEDKIRERLAEVKAEGEKAIVNDG